MGEGQLRGNLSTCELRMYFADDEYLSRLCTRGLRLGGADPCEELLQHPHQGLVVLGAKHLQGGRGRVHSGMKVIRHGGVDSGKIILDDQARHPTESTFTLHKF